MSIIMFPPKINSIIELLKQGGATEVLVVGGFVRDHLLGIESKDVDLEVYGLEYRQILDILRPHFHASLVGQSFGVLKVDNEIDVALPRRESKQGSGHKEFDVQSDPGLDPMIAFARRDFTINAIGMRPDGTLVDPYHGADDLKRKILRATSIAFKDDPLRVLRGMQFAARFGFTMEKQTITWCHEVFSELPTLSEERIYGEWGKWASKGIIPSRGLDILTQTGWIAGFPELQSLVGCEQSPQWHAEGDVWEHTKLVCDAMAAMIRQSQNGDEPLTQEEQIVLMFAALLHDVGKSATSVVGEDGLIHAHGHAQVGGPMAESFLHRMRAPIRVCEMVRALVTEHMAFYGGATSGLKGVRRLACRLAPANVRLWAMLCQADMLGSYAEPSPDSFSIDYWLDLARQASVRDEKPRPLVQGRDLIPLGIAPGVAMGNILDFAFEGQLDGEFDTTASGLEYLRRCGKIPWTATTSD